MKTTTIKEICENESIDTGVITLACEITGGKKSSIAFKVCVHSGPVHAHFLFTKAFYIIYRLVSHQESSDEATVEEFEATQLRLHETVVNTQYIYMHMTRFILTLFAPDIILFRLDYNYIYPTQYYISP